jgi:hypothetical protein
VRFRDEDIMRQARNIASRPGRTIITVLFASAVAVAGCAAHSTAVHPAAAPAAPKVGAPAGSPAADPAVKRPTHVTQPSPDNPTTPRQPAERPVLADGRYDVYIRTVDAGRKRLVVDLVQVLHGEAAVKAAIEDGTPRDTAQYLNVYIRDRNPRLRTLPLARDVRLDLRGSDCEAPRSQQLSKLATDARAMSGSDHTYYFTLTVRDGAVHRVEEFLAINAC